MSLDNTHPHADGERPQEAIAAYLQAVDAGQAPDRDALLARHPDLADDLRAFFADHDSVRQLAGSPLAGASLPPQFGDYELLEELGHGGMGLVVRVRDRVLNRELAVKTLREKLAEGDPRLHRFREEAHITAQLQHPGIPPVHELGELPDSRPFFAMKLVRGETLSARLRGRSSAAEDLAELLRCFEQVCEALAYAHNHDVIHRDLKPLNVMIGAHGEVQVMDWGWPRSCRARLA